MSQSDLVLEDQPINTVIPDIQNGLQALASLSSGATPPSAPFDHQLWYDTSTSTLKKWSPGTTSWGDFADTLNIAAVATAIAALATRSSLALQPHVTGGTGDEYTITTGESLTSVAANQMFLIRPDRENVDEATLVVDGLPAKNITFTNDDTTPVPTIARQIRKGRDILLRNDGTQYVGLTPPWAATAQVAGGTQKGVVPDVADVAAMIAAFAPAAGGFKVSKVYTSNNTWTKEAGTTKVLMILTGGGSGAGDATNKNGGTGATGIKFLDVSAIASATITVGAGGAGDSNVGGSGGDTSWADGTNTITAGRGRDGNDLVNSSATNADINLRGMHNNVSTQTSASFWGGGLWESGASALVYGCGGCGNSNSSGDGGNGAGGIAWILEFA